MPDTEKQFESDIEQFLISPEGGWIKCINAGYRAGNSQSVDGDYVTSYIWKEVLQKDKQKYEFVRKMMAETLYKAFLREDQ